MRKTYSIHPHVRYLFMQTCKVIEIYTLKSFFLDSQANIHVHIVQASSYPSWPKNLFNILSTSLFYHNNAGIQLDEFCKHWAKNLVWPETTGSVCPLKAAHYHPSIISQFAPNTGLRIQNCWLLPLLGIISFMQIVEVLYWIFSNLITTACTVYLLSHMWLGAK